MAMQVHRPATVDEFECEAGAYLVVCEAEAAVGQDQLEQGRFCVLFTDLANPTSNRIYQEIGRRRVTDVDRYRFEAHA